MHHEVLVCTARCSLVLRDTGLYNEVLVHTTRHEYSLVLRVNLREIRGRRSHYDVLAAVTRLAMLTSQRSLTSQRCSS